MYFCIYHIFRTLGFFKYDVFFNEKQCQPIHINK